MNYKLWTWKRLFCYHCSSDTLYTNLKASIVPPLPECDLKCQISFLLTTPDQAHRKEAGLLHKVSPGPVGAVWLKTQWSLGSWLLKDRERGMQTRNACLCQKEVQDKNVRMSPRCFAISPLCSKSGVTRKKTQRHMKGSGLQSRGQIFTGRIL